MKTRTLTLVLILIGSTLGFTQPLDLRTNEIAMTVEHEEEATLVQWRSTREVNTSYFLVEKSIDGITYETVHTVGAGGSTYCPNRYQFEDLDRDTLGATYRIVLVCMDGARITSNTLYIEPLNLVHTIVD
ncbi:MAG: hypothetical protein JJ975_08585 [Bacteroidia bacterium]|nr:hypothetical protein [Bacteroidia bacterium]